MKPGPGERPALYAILGDPVAHSLSPAIHNAAFRAAGRHARYVARRVSADECGEIMRTLAMDGGGGNVTVPHKERVVRSLDRYTPVVAATGACNTFWTQDGEVWGDNTDVAGFMGSWRSAVSFLTDTSPVLVLGAGGAARAVLHGLLRSAGISLVLMWNRTRPRAGRLADELDDDRVRLVADWRATAPAVVVNTTSVGIRGRRAPIDLEALATPPRVVIDLVYGKDLTPLCRQAERLDIACVDGRGMLVLQAEASYARWFGRAPPRDVMGRALEAACRDLE
ncbi:MAG: shikimate dehydrogenase [Gemmatimonadota bacterium]|nr:shikimate dehydrogenase [Gemmatimonadota bacterium]